MKYAIYLYFLWAFGKMAYFYYYKKFERKYCYRKWYVFSHWFSCPMLSVSCFCMALCFDAWSEGIERAKFFWMAPSVFTFVLSAVFFFESKIVLEEEKFHHGNYPLETFPNYRYRYWIRLRSILALLSTALMGGYVFFTFGI
jgi:hypothetical protein